MQGRLSKPIENNIQIFPKNTWKTEFDIAEKIGFELIEYIFDSYENPILTDKGLVEIKSILDKSNIQINSVCADYFMKNLLFDVSTKQLEQNLKILNQLIRQCSKIGIKIIELPFVDSSSLLPKNKINEIIVNLQKSVSTLEEYNICIALETDLPPNQFFELLTNFDNPLIKANYDIGNSVYKGYNISKELEILKKFIVNIHVKDRKIKSSTVPLGTGDVDFDLFFKLLSKMNYSKDLIIQGAREDLNGSNIEPYDTCSKYLTFVKNFMSKY
jgi:L-ribulose-5-phosphate 3-epimerase